MKFLIIVTLIFLFPILIKTNVKALSGYPFPDASYCRKDSVSGVVYGCEQDDWDFYKRECTSYAAWIANSYLGNFKNYMKGPNGKSQLFGNALTWDDTASNIGYPVDNIPIVGSIVVWNAGVDGAGDYGHVAYVEAVNLNNTFNISEYNWNASSANFWLGDHKYNTRSNKSIITGVSFIHFSGSGTCGGIDVSISNQTINGPYSCNAKNSINISPNTTINPGTSNVLFYIQ